MIARVLQPCRLAGHAFVPGELLADRDPRVTRDWLESAARDGLVEVIGYAVARAPITKEGGCRSCDSG